jgi:thiol-disulfide isomerase/thioredoxin
MKSMPNDYDRNDVSQNQKANMSENREPLSPETQTTPDWVKLGLLFFALAVLVYLVVNPVRPKGIDGTDHLAVGSRLMDLDLQPLTFDGDPVHIADVRGKVVLINYWGTWCGPCRIEFPHLVDIYKEFHDEDSFLFLSVSCLEQPGGDQGMLKERTASFLSAHNADFPTFSDLQVNSRRALLRAVESDTFAYPATVILDRENRIRGLWQGYRSGSEAEIRQLIIELLK